MESISIVGSSSVSEQFEQGGSENKTVSGGGETPAKPSFKPHMALVLLAILVMAATLVRVIMVVSKQGLESYNISYEIGRAVGVILWPFVFGWIAYRLFKRSNRAGNIIFAAFLIAGMVNLARDVRGQNRVESQKLAKESAALAERASAAAAKGETDKAIALNNQAATKAEESAKALGGYNAITGEYGASVGKRINELMRIYLASVSEFTKAGGPSCTGLTDEEVANKRLAVLDDAIEKHNAVLTYLNSIAETMPKDLTEKGVPPDLVAKFVEGFMSGGKVNNVIRIHELEHDMLNIFGAKLDILKQNLGKWRCKEGNIAVGAEFPDEQLKEFNDLQAKLDGIVKEQGALTAEVQKKK